MFWTRDIRKAPAKSWARVHLLISHNSDISHSYMLPTAPLSSVSSRLDTALRWRTKIYPCPCPAQPIFAGQDRALQDTLAHSQIPLRHALPCNSISLFFRSSFIFITLPYHPTFNQPNCSNIVRALELHKCLFRVHKLVLALPTPKPHWNIFLGRYWSSCFQSRAEILCDRFCRRLMKVHIQSRKTRLKALRFPSRTVEMRPRRKVTGSTSMDGEMYARRSGNAHWHLANSGMAQRSCFHGTPPTQIHHEGWLTIDI